MLRNRNARRMFLCIIDLELDCVIFYCASYLSNRNILGEYSMSSLTTVSCKIVTGKCNVSGFCKQFFLLICLYWIRVWSCWMTVSSCSSLEVIPHRLLQDRLSWVIFAEIEPILHHSRVLKYHPYSFVCRKKQSTVKLIDTLSLLLLTNSPLTKSLSVKSCAVSCAVPSQWVCLHNGLMRERTHTHRRCNHHHTYSIYVRTMMHWNIKSRTYISYVITNLRERRTDDEFEFKFEFELQLFHSNHEEVST